mmetsp:Transcript_2940/g.6815  ORF Transcript_2940/g.6815 Transcript_2940/m.6815 type:complete len:128 (+) Transcript_2940:1827-2210(+)
MYHPPPVVGAMVCSAAEICRRNVPRVSSNTVVHVSLSLIRAACVKNAQLVVPTFPGVVSASSPLASSAGRFTNVVIAVLHSASIVRRGLILLAFLLAHTAVSLFAHPVNLCPPPVLHVLLAWTIMAL